MVFGEVGVSDVVAGARVRAGAGLGTDDEGPVVGIAVVAGGEGGSGTATGVEGYVESRLVFARGFRGC